MIVVLGVRIGSVCLTPISIIFEPTRGLLLVGVARAFGQLAMCNN